MKNNVKVQDETQSLQSCVSGSVTAYDFRGGNYISHIIFGDCKIYGLDDETICIQRNDQDIKEWFESVEYEPILINDYWLIKLGFKKFKGNNTDFFLDDFESSCNKELWFWKGTQVKIKYVHELQNLYFVLTGRDLTDR